MQDKTEQDWKSSLTPEQYRITRQKGTEAPFSGEYNDFKDDGYFHCICCDTTLFDSKNKYDSGSGWPSFWSSIDKNLIEEQEDRTHWVSRVEITCKQCGSHLGHVFQDGPEPTGLRYCVNSVSLKFQKR